MAKEKKEVIETKETKVTEKKKPAAKKTTKASSEKKATTTKKASTSKKAEVKEEKKVAKKEKKVEVKAALRTEATAKVLGLKATPRKVRLVLDLVRGKKVDEALAILSITHKDSANAVSKLIKSAAANAVNNFNMNEDKLYVASIQASDSFKMRRYLPRAKGSASGLVKRFSNVYVTLKEAE